MTVVQFANHKDLTTDDWDWLIKLLNWKPFKKRKREEEKENLW